MKRLLTLMNEEWHWIQTTKQRSWKILSLQQTKVRPSILMFSQAVFYKKILSQSLYWLQNKEPLSNQMCVDFN